MTPKEKAKKIVGMYKNPIIEYPKEENIYYKECALISVNQIIQSNPHSNPLNSTPYSTMDYWFDVKKEIEKL